jgi:hypothetical protein
MLVPRAPPTTQMLFFNIMISGQIVTLVLVVTLNFRPETYENHDLQVHKK